MYTEKVIIVTTDEKIFSKDFKGSDIEYLASLINAEKLSFFEADPKRTTIKIWDKNGQPDELTFNVFFDKNQEKCKKVNALISGGHLNKVIYGDVILLKDNNKQWTGFEESDDPEAITECYQLESYLKKERFANTQNIAEIHKEYDKKDLPFGTIDY